MKVWVLIVYAVMALLGLVVVLHYVLKSMDRTLDKLFPTSYDQKGETGRGLRVPRRGTKYRGEG